MVAVRAYLGKLFLGHFIERARMSHERLNSLGKLVISRMCINTL